MADQDARSAARHHRLSDAHAEAWIASHNRTPTRDKVSSALRVLDDGRPRVDLHPTQEKLRWEVAA